MRFLIDLDNTLLDRAAAFERWAGHFVDELAGGPDDRDWLITADADGYTPRARLAGMIKDRFGLATGPDTLVRRMMTEHVELIAPFPGVTETLQSLGAGGAARVIVSNGTEHQQRRKIMITGLAELVDEVIISETAGCKKPDPEIFRLACGPRPDPATTWMIGDHPEADIRGAARLGLSTGWVDRGRNWDGDLPPSVSAPLAPAVIAAALRAAGQS